MTRTVTAALVLMLTAAVLPAAADDAGIVVSGTPQAPVPTRVGQTVARPAVLPALYASYAGLQAYDVYSTRQALRLGAREANPLMQGAARSSAAMIGLKTGVTVATIVAAERMWKANNKMGAIAVLVASNSVAAIVAARNARTLSQVR